jgi:hypothetical protein
VLIRYFCRDGSVDLETHFARGQGRGLVVIPLSKVPADGWFTVINDTDHDVRIQREVSGDGPADALGSVPSGGSRTFR